MNATETINGYIENETLLEYRGKQAIITKITDHGQNGEITIDATIGGKHQSFVKEPGEQLSLFLLSFKVLPEPESTVPASIPKSEEVVVRGKKENFVPQTLRKYGNTFDRLSAMLLDDIEKVRKDPSYVAQAKQVANSANAIINLAKLELDMVMKG